MPHGAPAHIATIEGRKALVVENAPPLPQKLDALLASMFSVRVRADFRPSGATVECEALRIHPFRTIREGRHFGLDRVLRDLRVEMCPRCGAVCVRDVSYDLAVVDGERVAVGRNGPRRRDLIVGWYSGARRNRREYR